MKLLIVILFLTVGNANAYAYASSPEHREGITAFLQKRKPEF